jgi:hypothetical protein
VTILQPVKQGLSAPVVTSIPQQWSAAWFRSFITNYLQNADVRNAATGSGVDVTSTNFTQPATIGLTPIPDGSVLGSIEPGLNPPQALTKAQLTSLVNIFSRTASGAVPAAPDQDPTLFLNAVGEFVAVPIPPPVAPTSVPFWVPQEDADDNLIIPGPPGKDGINGTGSGGPAVVLLQQEEPEDYMFVPGQIGPKGNTGPTGAPGLNGASLPLVIYPEDPEDPSPPVPGGPGPQGGTGPAGQIGPAGVPMLLYPDDPDDTLVVPGPQGQTGKTGAPGAQFVVYPEDPDDPMPPVPGAAGPQGAQGIPGLSGGVPGWYSMEGFDFDETMLYVTGGGASQTGFANPTGLIGLTAVNGVLNTAERSDSRHAIDQSITPTWTGLHTFNSNSSSPVLILAGTSGQAFAVNNNADTAQLFTVGFNGNVNLVPSNVNLTLATVAGNATQNNGNLLLQGIGGSVTYVRSQDNTPLQLGANGASYATIAPTGDFTVGNYTGITGFGVGRIQASGTTPVFALYTQGAPANQGVWDNYTDSSHMFFRCLNDAYTTAANWLTVVRSGTAPVSATFNCSLAYNAATSTGASVPTIGTNKPGSAVTLGPVTWETVVINGTTYYRPLWQ